MTNALYFEDKEDFKNWLIANHSIDKGQNLFIYKKGYTHLGISYEDAVQAALCYGWIDSITHRCDEEKFLQYFSPRKKNSHWSLSNLLRMKSLFKSDEMTAHGLVFFPIDSLQDMITEKQRQQDGPVSIPEFFKDLLIQKEVLNLFKEQTKSVQQRYIQHILEAKKDETKLRRCHKIIDILIDYKEKD